jgi:hypothetical protein
VRVLPLTASFVAQLGVGNRHCVSQAGIWVPPAALVFLQVVSRAA